MSTDQLSYALLVLSIVVVAYHHIGYPVLLRRLANLQRKSHTRASEFDDVQIRLGETSDGSDGADTNNAALREALPSMVVIVPAYNEAAVIAQKIANLAQLSYPGGRLSFVIALDGCTDETKSVAEAAIARAGRDLDFKLVDFVQNRGKIAVLNDMIGGARADIVALSDASAMINADAALKAGRHFSDEHVGVVCATYELAQAGSEGERKYWQLQTQIKADEAEVAAPMGAHGALYFFRRALWQPLPPDTINDDFVLPMRIVAAGNRAVYDRSIIATEIEETRIDQEFRRRIRIGAGNMQQLVRMTELANPRSGGLAFLFLSGKGLRPVIPFLIVLAVAATTVPALRGERLFQLMLAGELVLFALALAAIWLRSSRLPRPIRWLGYLVEGHTASAVGAVSFLLGQRDRPWLPAGSNSRAAAPTEFIPTAVQIGKRAFDIVVALVGLVLLAILIAPVAIAIKRESPGPVFFRQTRVGRSTRNATYLFDLVKFRSMKTDAEAQSGPVYASAEDPRITKVGRFMRKTRIDELPQFYNVLVGDMSIIGPRPERPWFVRQHDVDYPFYTERTGGLRPGITGLAQVNQDYEGSIRDISTKLAYDHAYLLRLSDVWSWIRTDLWILFKTFYVVVARRGQ